MDPILEELMKDLPFLGLPEGVTHHATATRECGKLTIHLVIEDDTILSGGFEFEGDAIIGGCAALLLYSTRGQTVRWGSQVRCCSLAHAVRLQPGDDRVATTVEAFLAALPRGTDDIYEPPVSPRVARGAQGYRNATLSPPTRADLNMLRPGETYEMLMRERNIILGVLQNLDACRSIDSPVHTLRQDQGNGDREEIICLLADIDRFLPRLSESDQRLVALLGLSGMTEREAADAMGVSQPAVHLRSRRIAALIQQFQRSRTAG